MANEMFEYSEYCPHCNNESNGVCDENVKGRCEHCGEEIMICSLCPATCISRHDRTKWHEYCDGCPFRLLDCKSIECGEVCFADMKKTVNKDGLIVLVNDKSLMLKGKGE